MGVTKERIVAHTAVLSQSPILARFCNALFKETVERVIELPEDDPEDFAQLLEYLYSGDYEMKNNATAEVIPLETALKLARVYILADKYQLPGLQKEVVWKMGRWWPHSCSDFFTMASLVYQNTPDSDRPFKDFLARRDEEIYAWAVDRASQDDMEELDVYLLVRSKQMGEVEYLERELKSNKDYSDENFELQIELDKCKADFEALSARACWYCGKVKGEIEI